MREGLAALRLNVDAGFYPEVSRRLLEENGLAASDAIVYAQVTRGAAPRTHAFPPPGTPPTVFAFARLSDPLPPDGRQQRSCCPTSGGAAATSRA